MNRMLFISILVLILAPFGCQSIAVQSSAETHTEQNILLNPLCKEQLKTALFNDHVLTHTLIKFSYEGPQNSPVNTVVIRHSNGTYDPDRFTRHKELFSNDEDPRSVHVFSVDSTTLSKIITMLERLKPIDSNWNGTAITVLYNIDHHSLCHRNFTGGEEGSALRTRLMELIPDKKFYDLLDNNYNPFIPYMKISN